jgi:ATP-binding cassette subfamily B protein
VLRRLACVRQADRSDCGAAALATIALHHRVPIGLQRLRDLTGTDRAGTDLLGLLHAAEGLGFSARGARGTYEDLSRVPLPAIAHVRTEQGEGHFVVLHRVTPRGALVADPARGIQRISHEEFRRRWTGQLLLVAPGEAAARPGPHVGSAGPRRRFLGLLAAHMPILIEASACALLMTLLGIGTSYFVQHLVDSVLVRNEAVLLNALGVGMVLVVAFRTLFGVLRQYLVAHVGRKVDLALIAAYAGHILRLPVSFFENRRVGEILSRVNDASKVREAVSGTTLTAVVDGTLVAVTAGFLWCSDPHLALVALAFVPALVLGVLAHHPAARRRSREAMEGSARLSAHLVEDACGIETVKAFGAERARLGEGESRLVRVVQATFALQKLTVSANGLGMFATSLAGVVILWYGGYRVMAGALTVGQLMFFYTLLGCLLEPLQRLASASLQIQDAVVAVDRLSQVLDLETEPVGAAKKVPFRGVRRAIELRGVGFRYGYRSRVLEGLDLEIPAGKTVAIVGESGSGKSTLLKLLMGYHAPTEGHITIDGVDLRDHELGSLRAGTGLVTQEPFVFNGSVFENIALGRPDATSAEVIEAARAAGLEEFIADLPDRYETLIGERGANLSGGQRQRLAIARAILRRPEILIFDEATSHLDTATERAIRESLRTVLAGKTVVLVAHRLSTIKEADLIYVLRRGRVVEAGTHSQLLVREGWYWSLWRAQADDEPRPSHRPHAGGASGNGRTDREGLSHA